MGSTRGRRSKSAIKLGMKTAKEIEEETGKIALLPRRTLFHGILSFIFLSGLLAWAIVSFSRAESAVIGIVVFGLAALPWPFVVAIGLMIFSGLFSLRSSLIGLLDASLPYLESEAAARISAGDPQALGSLIPDLLFTIIFPALRKAIAKGSLTGKLISFALGLILRSLRPRVQADMEKRFSSIGQASMHASKEEDKLSASASSEVEQNPTKIMLEALSSTKSFLEPLLDKACAVAGVLFSLVSLFGALILGGIALVVGKS